MFNAEKEKKVDGLVCLFAFVLSSAKKVSWIACCLVLFTVFTQNEKQLNQSSKLW